MNCSGSWGRADGCGSPSTGRSGITTSRCGWPRAIPVQVAAFRKTPIFRSQNVWEHTFLRPRETGRTAVLLCDRGFHRVSGLQLLRERKPSFAGSPALPPRAGGRPPAGQGPRGLGPRAGRTLVGPTPGQTGWPWMTGAWVSGYPGRPLRRKVPHPPVPGPLHPPSGDCRRAGPRSASPASRKAPPLPAPGGHRACRVRLSVRFIQRHLPSPQLRAFAWLQTAEATS